MPCAVIVTALSVEYLAVRAHLSNLREEIHQGTIYERGSFAANGQTWEVGIVEAGSGSAGAAGECLRAIQYFMPEVILFVGIATGIKDTSLGDVVVASKIYRYELGLGRSEERFFPRPEIRLFSSYVLEERAKAEVRKKVWLERLPSPISEPVPRVFFAPIVVGKKVIALTKSKVFEFLQENYRDALAVEMEELGSLEAMDNRVHVPAILIRGISDLIDTKLSATTECQETAARHASAFAFQLLTKQILEKELTHRENKKSSQEKYFKRILILSANPKTVSKLRLFEEIREIQTSLLRSGNRDQFEISSRVIARSRDLQQSLLDDEPRIIHFIGHGVGSEGLSLENEDGQTKLVSAKALRSLFDLFADRLDCVVLNACYSEVQAEAISKSVSYVIGVKKEIGDRAGIEFITAFYDALGAGESVEFAYQLGCNAIALAEVQSNQMPVLKQKLILKLPGNIIPERLPTSHLEALGWDITRLLQDLEKVKGKNFSQFEQECLCFLLVGVKPDEIAKRLSREASSIRVSLSHGLYSYIEAHLGKRPESWRDVQRLYESEYHLEEALDGQYKNQDLFQKPLFPSNFVGRNHILQEIKRKILLHDSNFTNRTQVIVIQGLGGIGKTTLAAAIAHDSEIRQHFSDRIFWATLHQQSELLNLFQSWMRALGDYRFQATTAESALAHFRGLIGDKSILLVLDDAQDASQIELLFEIGQQCCVLITSRNKFNLDHQFAIVASEYHLDVFAPDESLALLSMSLNRQLDQLEQKLALRVAEKIGHHPLALSLIPGLINQGESWSDLEQRLSSLEKNFEHEPDDQIRVLEALYAREEVEDENLISLYSVQILFPSTPISVGSEVEVGLQLSPFEHSDSDACLIERMSEKLTTTLAVAAGVESWQRR